MVSAVHLPGFGVAGLDQAPQPTLSNHGNPQRRTGAALGHHPGAGGRSRAQPAAREVEASASIGRALRHQFDAGLLHVDQYPHALAQVLRLGARNQAGGVQGGCRR